MWSHCGFGEFDSHTNALVEVASPSRHCATWVALVDGELTEHERTDGGRCPWIGVRVVDDRADLLGMPDRIVDTEAARWSREQ
jgi:hypothetical protein